MFQPMARLNAGVVPFLLGTGAITPANYLNALPLDIAGNVLAIDDGVVARLSQGIPYDADGRVCVTTTGSIDSTGNGAMPYSSRQIAIGGVGNIITEGIGFDADGKLATS